MALSSSRINAATGAIKAGSSALNTINRTAAAISNADSFGSLLRSVNIPAMGEIVGDIAGVMATFEGDQYPNDWRVRLSVANWSSFRSSPVLVPLRQAGGLIFPFTPSITIKSNGSYSGISTVHTNYTHQAFSNSDPGSVSITAPFYVEDPSQGLYWVAAIHYLRSLTKMFTGNDPKAGNPPPIVYLNGYGNYVFKNVPVVVSSFSCTLDDKCDYIGVDVVGSLNGLISGVADSVGGISNAVGNVFSSLSPVTNAVSAASNIVGTVSNTLSSIGLTKSISGGVTHVPTKSTITIELLPTYSRVATRSFSLDRFVTGGYINNTTGYI